MFHNKNILIGITGGIAAYKIPLLVRLFVKAGANVKVILTKDATQFVTPQTLSVLSKNEVHSDFFDNKNQWNNHVALAEWADVFVVAPLTANTLAKMASGVCDNLLLAVYFSSRSKVYLTPAMDLEMYQHPTFKGNIEKVKGIGNVVIPAESGELASGLSGEGRMAEPENIFTFIEKDLKKQLPLLGKKVLINAGPTYEAIDPVRFIGNRSSGKMGISIADKISESGAEVTLVLGPTGLTPQNQAIKIIKVESSDEMYEQCISLAKKSDIIICSAAVADYKAKIISKEKIKKSESYYNIELERTKDILGSIGKQKTKSQFLVGFALETTNLIQYAKDKLKKKNLDLIIANNATNQKGSVFGSDSNQISIIDKNNKITKFELLTKAESAKKIVDFIINCTAKKLK